MTPLLVYVRHSSLAGKLNLLHDDAKFNGFGDLSLIGLPLDSPEWNELKLDDIRLRVKAGRYGIKFDNLIWNGSLEQIEKYIVEVAYQKSIEQSSQGQTKKSRSRR